LLQGLLLRQTFLPGDSGINFLLLSFANWFTDDLFQTQHGTNGTFLMPGEKFLWVSLHLGLQ